MAILPERIKVVLIKEQGFPSASKSIIKTPPILAPGHISSTSLSSDQMSHPAENELVLHPFLQYYQHEVAQGHCTSILWDLRDAPFSSIGAGRVTSVRGGTLTASELGQPATTPPVHSLTITCGLIPWRITAIGHTRSSPTLRGGTHRDGDVDGGAVTVLDVLSAVHTCLQTQLTHEEWDRMCVKHQQRISLVFDARWRMAPDPDGTHAYGVLRVDCLLKSTWFGGLSIISRSVVEFGEGCILTLRRPR